MWGAARERRGFAGGHAAGTLVVRCRGSKASHACAGGDQGRDSEGRVLGMPGWVAHFSTGVKCWLGLGLAGLCRGGVGCDYAMLVTQGVKAGFQAGAPRFST